jgi:hypothetical protein
VTAGVVVGVAGRFLACRGRSVPLWLPIAAAVAAAMLATFVARMTGSDRPDPTLFEIVLQVLLTATAVAAVALTADRRQPLPSGGATAKTRIPTRNRWKARGAS